MEENNKPIREDGFYWVKDGFEWTIARWSNDSILDPWSTCPDVTEYFYAENHFSEVDERRIVRQ